MSNQPLAERSRPKNLDQYIGQDHLLGVNALLRKTIESGIIHSFILWGPPGVGKTTLAKIIARKLNRTFYELSAINSGVKDVRETIDQARKQQFFNTPSPILFIDEIHRFSKSQQDSLLGAVEAGIITLIGATTENPSFEVISPLLSRCQVYVLKPLDEDSLIKIAQNAISTDPEFSGKKVDINETRALVQLSGGDARKLLNVVEIVIHAENSDHIIINDEVVMKHVQKNITEYDKNGEMHYDVISAFIKSIRGSDPNAAVYWLARMVEGGEDPKFIARRLVILAAEDVGLANPNALLLASRSFDAIHQIGWPESRIILSEVTLYLANSPKSNSAYEAINTAQDLVRKTGNLPVPLHLRNAPTRLMKDLGYGADYKYAHSYAGNFVADEFLPEELKNTQIYKPQNNPQEIKFLERLKQLWQGKYKY